MAGINHNSELVRKVQRFVLRGFTPRFGELERMLAADATWQRLTQLGSRLWLDTGDIEAAEELWTKELTALTTNNTLLNREVQKGIYDDLIVDAYRLLAEFPDITDRQRKLELAFILNAYHGLRLVERFDAHVSVEEHTDLVDDVEETVVYALRFHAICPRRFIVKVPITPAGILAARRLRAQGVPVNQTLGFSARQNLISAAIAQPAFVNVFLGRLSSFMADNSLGSGVNVGERATLASQRLVAGLRKRLGVETLQIAASIRGPEQIRDLAGVDVLTMPPKAARAFLDLHLTRADIADRTSETLDVPLRGDVNAASIRLDTLWDVTPQLESCIDSLRSEPLDQYTPDHLMGFLADHDCGDVFPQWTDKQVLTSVEEGKIPRLKNWRDALAKGEIGLDSLMNLAGINSFRHDQERMDDRVRTITRTVESKVANRSRS